MTWPATTYCYCDDKGTAKFVSTTHRSREALATGVLTLTQSTWIQPGGVFQGPWKENRVCVSSVGTGLRDTQTLWMTTLSVTSCRDIHTVQPLTLALTTSIPEETCTCSYVNPDGM